ncbi:MAG: M23 family metallopeptidase [bacterium]|nr:M23 family metallopeptidase [bacterium]
MWKKFVRYGFGTCFILGAITLSTWDRFSSLLPLTSLESATEPLESGVPPCPAEELEDLSSEHPLNIERGDTLASLLKRHQINPKQIHQATQALRPVFDPRTLNPRHEVLVSTSPSEDDCTHNLLTLTIRPSMEYEIIVQQDEHSDYTAEKKERHLTFQTRRAEGSITYSLYANAREQGVPDSILGEMIRAFSYDVDFQRSIREGDQFGVYYEVMRDEETGAERSRGIVYAYLTLSGRTFHIYRYKSRDGKIAYYNEKGESIRKSLLKTPVDGARLSSRFGRRHHPVLGFTKMHKGIDFAAPPGTPIMAAGDGTIAKAGRWGSYGNYIRIRHNGTYSTAYAHMRRFAKGMKVGRRVKQGQIIGYVGSTGRVTGPHLHYEVLKKGTQINPLSIQQVSSGKLTGAQLKAFKAEKTRIDLSFQKEEPNQEG